jgi:hypothetical protein
VAQITPESFEAICSNLETTWEGLFALCKKHDVSRASFYIYKDATAENLDRYARAREKQLDYLEELMIDLSMQKKQDFLVDDKVNIGSNAIARARLQS